jgi:glycosyltransferase involved in cell wall biosynthesis
MDGPWDGTIALLYDDDAFVEVAGGRRATSPGGPAGLMGRQVAGRSFLDAYLAHGSWGRLVALVRDPKGAETLTRSCREHPSSRSRVRALQVVEEAHFHRGFLAEPPAPVLFTPCPTEPRYAWARRQAPPGSFALCGLTHTICDASMMRLFGEMVTAPFESYDALICTSEAVVKVVRAVTDAFADDLRDRHGGDPRLRARLERIPLGVDTEAFRPATEPERLERRRALGIGDDEVVLLYVGRLSHHAKAHPFPMYRGAAIAAAATGRPVRLVLAGWAANRAIAEAFVAGAREFAPGVRVTFVEDTDPTTRDLVYRAADVFVSFADNLQESFGLAVAQAMACGLPVVATDWDGYRDLVADGATGLLVPTRMVRDATSGVASRLAFGELDFDHFLAECSQAVAVDAEAAGAAMRRLVENADLRRRLGDAGRRRAVEQFAWPHVIRAYENLWRDQVAALAEFRKVGPIAEGPSDSPIYPDPERSFASYPTHWLDADDRLRATPEAARLLGLALALPLTNHVPAGRSADPALLVGILEAAADSATIADLDALFRGAGLVRRDGRATIAWLLKYGILQPA